MSHARSTDPQTSKDAGKALSPKSLMRLLLMQYRSTALTSLEAAELAGIDDDPGRKRVSDLKTCCLIEPVEDAPGRAVTRPGPTGNPREVCRLTEEGLNVLEGLTPMPSPGERGISDSQRNREIVERLTYWLTVSQEGARPGMPITYARARRSFDLFEAEMVGLVFEGGSNEE